MNNHSNRKMGFLQNLFKTETTDLHRLLKDGAVVIDVRSPLEYSAGHIKGSRNIPLESMKDKVQEVKKFCKPVIVVCQSGRRSNTAVSFLQGKGITAMNGGSWTALNNIV